MEMLFCSSEPLLSCYLHPTSLTPFYGWLYARASPLSVATSPPLSESYAHAPCHGTAIHLSVLDHAGIGFTILLRLSLTLCNRELGARHSHSIIESYSEYHRQGLDFPDSLECCHHSSVRHEDSG